MNGVEIVGTFDSAAWFRTLALILSQKHGAKITVTVTPPDGDEQAAEP